MWSLVLVLVLVAGCVREPLSTRPGTGPSVQLPADQSVTVPSPAPLRRLTQGEALYIRYCADCHGWQGQGNGPAAQLLEVKPPSLRRAELFARYTEAELVARVLLGKELLAPLTPAALPGTDTEVTALLTHLRRLPALSWEQVNEGQTVYDSLCVSCHGIYGRGDGPMAAALSSPPRDLSTPPYQGQVSDEELLHVISVGRGTMPGAVDVLSAEELRAVSAFVRLLSPGYELYDRFCAICHGPEGRPLDVNILGDALILKDMPVFDQTYLRTHTDEQLRPWVRHMLKENRAVMPHFANELSGEEVRQILTYLRTLPPES